MWFSYRLFLRLAIFLLPLAISLSAAAQPPTLTLIHPTEGQVLPPVKEVFAFGEVSPGSSLTINGMMIKVHPKGGYLAMVPLQPGAMLLTLEATTAAGEKSKLERHVTVSPGFVMSPIKPLTLQKETIEPAEDVILAPGDPLRVSFQGSPQASADFSIPEFIHHAPVAERFNVNNSTESSRGLYEGNYIIQPGDKANQAPVDILFKKDGKSIRARAKGRLTIDSGALPKTGIIVEDVTAVRTGPEGGYDLFLYKGMRVRLTGKLKNQRRVRLSSIQSGWIKESAVQELPRGTTSPRSYVANMVMAHLEDSTLIRVPLDAVLPYRVEQNLNPLQLVVTLYGAVDRTDLIRYDPSDALIRQVRWKQIAPDTCQIIVEPKFSKWWGYDVRYEDTSLIIEIRKPWNAANLKGMTIALDPGHGGPELGATGPHGTLEKDANLGIARIVRNSLELAGARVVMTRDSDMEVPLYERSRIAWRNRAQLFVSIHCNAAGVGENPLTTNGSSTYWYHPQSLSLARAVHSRYAPNLGLPDRGLFYSDFAVCRMTQMPAILTEQAYIILPEQEILLFSPEFQRSVAQSILEGIYSFLADK